MNKETYKIFDTHAHYDHELFGGAGPELLKDMIARDVICGAVIPAITFESNFCRDQFPKEEFPSVYFAAGLHPKCVLNEPAWGSLKRLIDPGEPAGRPFSGEPGESGSRDQKNTAGRSFPGDPGEPVGRPFSGEPGELGSRDQKNIPGAAKRQQDRSARILDLIGDERTAALKTGLDFSKKKLTDAQKEHQKQFMKLFIGLANHYKLPLVLHVRDAAEECVEVLRENSPETEAVVHCFNYDMDTARTMMEAGVTRFGIGGMLTRDENGPLRECVRELPLPNILLETDAPFVRPKGYEGEINTSVTLAGTARLIADLKGIAVGKVIEAANRNAAEFYRLKNMS